MNKWIYISSGILGVILSLMEYYVADSEEFAYTILLATAMLLVFLYIFDEWNFYRRHNALLASSQFLILPSFLLILGNVIAPLGLNGTFIEFAIDLSFRRFYFSSTLTSLALIFPSYFLLYLFAKYYDRRFPGFVVRREMYGPTKLPLLINVIVIGFAYFSGYMLRYMDLIVMVFTLGSVIQLITKKLFPLFRARGRPARRTTPVRQISRASNYIEPSSDRTRQRRDRRDISTRPSRGVRSVGTSPSDGYRDIPVRARNSSSPRSEPTRSETPSRAVTRPRNYASVEEGIEMVSPSRKARKVKPTRVSEFLPRGNHTKDDLRCIVCYEAFTTNSGGNVIVCPSCKYPAHERELRSWFNQSDRCPRCNKEVKALGVLKSKYLISVSQYVKIIK